VHDALPLKGYYGEGNKQLFKFGIENNDVLLPVSKDALRQCGKLRNCKEIIPYSCFYDPIFRPPALPISLRLGIVTPVEDKELLTHFRSLLFLITRTWMKFTAIPVFLRRTIFILGLKRILLALLRFVIFMPLVNLTGWAPVQMKD
jgi:hypothetical protein